MSFYDKVPYREPPKPCMADHTGSSTGAKKTYTVEVHGATTKVSIDCLNLSYVLHINT